MDVSRVEDVEQRFQRAFDEAPVGMMLFRADRGIIRANHALAELLGITPEQMRGVTAASFVDRDDFDVHAPAVREVLARTRERYECELRLRGNDGLVPVRVTFGGIDSPRWRDACLVYVQDLRSHLAYQQRIDHQALHDPVTDLPNRHLLLDRLEVAMGRRRRSSSSLFVLGIDLERFRAINERLGHAAGDHLLQIMTARLLETLRAGDTVSRIGADEFVAVCDDVDDIEALVDALVEALERPTTIEGHTIHPRVRIGVVRCDRAMDPERLLGEADLAIDRSKAEGQKVAILDAAGAAVAHRQLRIEAELREAFELHELFVEYQPIIDTARRQAVAVEALLRWQHPTHGRMNPEVFVPVAERTGLIVPIGTWVLRESCVTGRRLSDLLGRDIQVNVNLSAYQLTVGLDEIVAAALDDAGLEPHLLCLEVTEGNVMVDPEAAASVLGRLHDLGVRVAIDDFGTGHSSLSHLRDLPVDVVKIDRSFVSRIASGTIDDELLTGIVELCHRIGMSVCAEGVETVEQLSGVTAAGCDQWQGFLHASSHELGDLLGALERQGPGEEVAVSDVERAVTGLGYEDLLVFRRVGPHRFAHVGGYGRGTGWAGIIDVDLAEDPELRLRLELRRPAVSATERSHRVIGPYFARSHAMVPLGDDVVVVLGHQHDVVADPDTEVLVDVARVAAETTWTVSPAKRLADELEVLEAVQALLRVETRSLEDALGHLARCAVEALSCDLGVAHLRAGGRSVVVGDVDELCAEQLQEFVAELDRTLDGPLCIQDLTLGGLPDELTDRLRARSCFAVPIGDGLGTLFVVHTDARPRGFTSLCQSLGIRLAASATVLLDSAASGEQLRTEMDRVSAEARRDPLTQLGNRLAWSEAVDAADAADGPNGVIVVDVDGLKTVNDEHGHHFGDELLERAGTLLRTVVRGGDIIARLGGDEFAVLLPGADSATCREVAERIAARDPRWPVHSDAVSLSVGWASTDVGGTVTEALHRADVAMYREKTGRPSS